MSADKPQRNYNTIDPVGTRPGNPGTAKAMSQKADTFSTLSSCRDLAADLLSKSLSTMLDKIEESLFDLAEKALDRDTYNLYMQARGEAQAKREDIEREFRRRFVEGFERAIHPDEELNKKTFDTLDFNNLELSLVGHDDYEEDLAVTNIATKLRNKLGDDLNALNQRLGHLMAKPEDQRENSPMGPQAIVDAFRSACQKIESDLNVRLLVLKQFEQVAAENVPDVYQNLNRFLVERNILPVLPKAGFRRSPARSPRPPATRQNPIAEGMEQLPSGDGGQYLSASDLANLSYGAQMGFGTGGFAPVSPMGGAQMPAYAVGNEQELLSTLQQLLTMNQVAQSLPTSLPQLGGAGAAAPTQEMMSAAPAMLPSVGQSFLDALNLLQQGAVEGALSDVGNLDTAALVAGSANVLHQLKSTSLATSLGHVDAMTIDIVAMLFDYVFDDDNIPGPMKALIGRLQIPVLKVAMLDSKFFARKQHPTRRLLDSLGHAALGWSEEDGLDDRLYVKIASIVNAIVEGFDENIGIFDTALADLEAFLAEEQALAEFSAEASASLLIAEERAEVAKLHAEQTVGQRLAAASGLPELIVNFLKDQWVAVLAHVLQTTEEDQTKWQDAVKAMDDLIWSIAPKTGVEERLRLVNMLPKLLKALDQETEAAGIDRAVREAFFADLVQCHAQAIKSGLRSAEALAAEAAAQPAVATAPVAPAQPVSFATATSELAPAAPAPVVVPQAQPQSAPVSTLADTGLLDLPPLDIGPASNLFEVTNLNWDQGLDRYQDYDDVVANQLKRGAWVDFRQADGSSMRAKLAWVSPRKSRYLFTNRQGQNGMEYTLAELIGMFKSGDASMIESGTSMERAVSNMIGMLQPAGA